MAGNTDNAGSAASLERPGEGVFATCFAKQGEFVSRVIAGESIVVPVRGRKGDLDAIYNLNEVAGFIWNRIDGQTSVRQLAEAVCSEFETGQEVADADTLRFITALQGAGLIAPASMAKD